MSRGIRPAEEEGGNIIPTILFMFLWYSGLLGIIASTGFDTMLLLFLIAGLLPLYSVVTSIRRALFYRRQRAEAIAGGQSCTGTDKSGWKYYLEDFQWKQNKNDPDIFDYPKEFEDTIMGQGNIIQIIFIVIMILMVLNTFFQIG